MGVTEINKDTIAEAISSNSIVVIKFYSSTCSVCELLLPVLEEVSQAKKEVGFFKIKTDQSMSVCLTYRVLSVPTILIFKDGVVVEKLSGFKTKEEIEEIINKIDI